MNSVAIRRWPSEVFILAADSREGLAERIAEARELLARHSEAAPVDLAAELNRRRGEGAMRLAAVAASLAELDSRLVEAAGRIEESDRIRDRSGLYFRQAAEEAAVALVFPGEASQYRGMLADLCVHLPEARAWFDALDRASESTGRPPLSSLVFGPAAGTEDLLSMDVGAESVTAADMALLEVVSRLGVSPQAVAGHSTGDWAALLAGGIFRLAEPGELAEHVAALNRRYRELRQAGALPDATLLAIGTAQRDSVDRLIAAAEGRLELAMDNCPHQLVLCGQEEDISSARSELERGGAVCQPLPFGRAYHTARFADFADGIGEFLAGLPLGPPQMDVYSCTTAAPYPKDPEAIREIMASQWRLPVRFRETVEAMYAAGARLFVEVGPRGLLTGFVHDVLRGLPHLAIASDDPRQPGTSQLNALVAELWVHGVELDLEILYSRRARPLEDPDAGKRAPVRLATGLPLLQLPADAAGRWAGERPLGLPDEPPAPFAEAERGEALEAYLATMERFLETQREVVGAYLSGARLRGAAPLAPTPPPQAKEPEPAAAASSPSPAPVADPAEPSDFAALVRRLVADRTGYPPEMLDQPLDLEGDLGIDSIKRVEILAAIQQETGLTIDMERAGEIRTLEELRQLAPESSTEAASPTTQPLLGPVTYLDGGNRLVVERRLDLETDPYLRDHALGGKVSDSDPELGGLPVLPLTMTIELMAEAAAALEPSERVLAVEDVRAHQWIALDRAAADLRIEAERCEDAVSVRVIDGESRAAEAVVRVGSPPGSAPAPELKGEPPSGPSPWPPEELYSHGMFHGPAFQGVAAIDSLDAEGIEATLRGLAPDSLPASGLITDPVLLDAAGQLIGYWAAARFGRGFTVFPFSVDSVEVYAPTLQPGGELRGRARIHYDGGPELRADIELTDASGRLHARLRGWRDLRFSLPERFFDLRLAPKRNFLGSELPASELGLPEDGSATAALVEDLPGVFLDAHGRIWMRVLAHLILSRRERVEWYELNCNQRRRAEWLRGRAAVKDAVRLLLRRHEDSEVFPADIEIATDERGAPRVRLPGDEEKPAPVISIAHTGEVAIGVAAESHHAGVGVDIEQPRSLPADFGETALAPEERHLANGSDSRLLALWCAKESAAKASGEGIGGNPQRFVIRAFDQDTGLAELCRAADANGDAPLRARTVRSGELTIATTIRERSQP